LQQHEGDGAEGQEEVGGADDEEQHQVQLGKIEAVERN
jgi:hypothetical protein